MVRGAFGWAVGGRCEVADKIKFGASVADQKIEAMRLTDPEGHLLNRYKCAACGWWHIGHNRAPGLRETS